MVSSHYAMGTEGSLVMPQRQVRLRPEPDAGLSLLEVVVAMAVFAVGVTALLGILVNTDGVVGDNIRRSAAANLVNQTLEVARAQTAVAITNGQVIKNQTVSGTTYTITQEA